MEKMVGAICWKKECEERELTFQEILLDETVIGGKIYVKREMLSAVGGINAEIHGKLSYELLLRIAKHAAIIQRPLENMRQEKDGDWLEVVPETCKSEEEGWKTDCYILGRYKGEFMKLGCFEQALAGLMSAEEEFQMQPAERRNYLEDMVTARECYWKIFDATQPILIYRGDEICYSVLDTFAEKLGEAFIQLGKKVEWFDAEKEDFRRIVKYFGKRFQAVIGMQTFMFSAKMQDGTFAHEKIIGPKYNYVFDHPIWLKNHLENTVNGLCVLTPDGNYADFVKKYYGLQAHFLPPAGIEKHLCEEKEWDVSFVGSIGEGFDGKLKQMLQCDRATRIVENHFIKKMKSNLKETPEKLFREVLDELDYKYTDCEFRDLFYEVRWMFYAMSQYYRKKVLELLLKAGIEVHVFGDSWKTCSLRKYQNLICHDAVLGEGCLEVYAKSRISLNIMTWHKDGFTERIANSMLQKSVVVTDWTKYIGTHFKAGEDMVIFELEKMGQLPQMIEELLYDEERQKRMSEKAYQIAKNQYTWHEHAEKFLKLVNMDKFHQKES